MIEAALAPGGDQSCEKAALIAEQNHLLGLRKARQERLLERFGRDVMSRVENDQIFQAAGNAPVAARVYFALIARVEPSAFERLCRFDHPHICAGRSKQAVLAVQ